MRMLKDKEMVAFHEGAKIVAAIVGVVEIRHLQSATPIIGHSQIQCGQIQEMPKHTTPEASAVKISCCADPHSL